MLSCSTSYEKIPRRGGHCLFIPMPQSLQVVINYSSCSLKTVFVLDDIKQLFIVLYTEDGSNLKRKQEDAYVHFCDFLDECSGQLCNNFPVFS